MIIVSSVMKMSTNANTQKARELAKGLISILYELGHLNKEKWESCMMVSLKATGKTETEALEAFINILTEAIDIYAIRQLQKLQAEFEKQKKQLLKGHP